MSNYGEILIHTRDVSLWGVWIGRREVEIVAIFTLYRGKFLQFGKFPTIIFLSVFHAKITTPIRFSCVAKGIHNKGPTPDGLFVYNYLLS